MTSLVFTSSGYPAATRQNRGEARRHHRRVVCFLSDGHLLVVGCFSGLVRSMSSLFCDHAGSAGNRYSSRNWSWNAKVLHPRCFLFSFHFYFIFLVAVDAETPDTPFVHSAATACRFSAGQRCPFEGAGQRCQAAGKHGEAARGE